MTTLPPHSHPHLQPHHNRKRYILRENWTMEVPESGILRVVKIHGQRQEKQIWIWSRQNYVSYVTSTTRKQRVCNNSTHLKSPENISPYLGILLWKGQPSDHPSEVPDHKTCTGYEISNCHFMPRFKTWMESDESLDISGKWPTWKRGTKKDKQIHKKLKGEGIRNRRRKKKKQTNKP